MGWDYCDRWRTAADLKRDIRVNLQDALVEERTVGNHWWVLRRDKNGDEICVYLLQKSNTRWGYKLVGERMGPYETDCPLVLLNKAGPPADEQAREWRERVRKAHVVRSKRAAVYAALRVGQWLRLHPDCKPSSVEIIQLKPRVLGRAADGTVYRIPESLVDASQADRFTDTSAFELGDPPQ